jgi:hypothetical protein
MGQRHLFSSITVILGIILRDFLVGTPRDPLTFFQAEA